MPTLCAFKFITSFTDLSIFSEAKRVQKEEIRTEEWADALERTIKHNPKYISKYFELLIDEEESEPQVLRRLYKAINKIYQTVFFLLNRSDRLIFRECLNYSWRIQWQNTS